MTDVFLSYSWAGNSDNPDLGEKGWVSRFQQALQSELTERMNRRATVFIDSQQRNHGYFATQLRDAVRSSRVFLFVVTEWSCRPDSWCHREIQTFLDSAKPIHGFTKPFTDRLAKVVLRPPVLNAEPPALRPALAKDFGVRDASGSWQRFDPDHLSHPGTPAAEALKLLADDLSALMQSMDASEAQELVPPTEQRTVFLGCGSPTTVDHRSWLREDFTRKGYSVIAHTPVVAESESEFRENTQSALQEADVAIFLIGDKEPRIPNWEMAPGEWQLRRAAEGLGKRGAWTYAWQDPLTAQPGASLLRSFQDRWALAENTEWIDNPSSAREKKTIQHLASNVEDRLQKRPLAETPLIRTPGVRYVLLHCDRKDDTQRPRRHRRSRAAQYQSENQCPRRLQARTGSLESRASLANVTARSSSSARLNTPGPCALARRSKPGPAAV